MIDILSSSDIKLNYVVILILHICAYSVSIHAIKGNRAESIYTKNIRLAKIKKIFLGFSFYKENIFEMEAVSNQIVRYILTAIFLIAGLYINLNPKVAGVFYMVVMFGSLGGCYIYRIKKGEFKEKNQYYK